MRSAREHAAARAAVAGADVDDVAEVVSELTTNVFVHGHPTSAVLVATHTANGTFWVTVLARQDEVELPEPTEDPEAESGRGLVLTRALTTVFRCERRQGGYQAFVAGFEVVR
ncbi:ATP-binding protein [Embleya sp. NBC_00896]|uniref:ATP-binding protein n=1 Tax=Embleya sp. NBC_00896 TaxID=2975961 RepID=UPI00386A887A|nr:ATP-binding protein [Embleya sp. NBC_00896]